jgi:hypothetical protein
MARLDLLHGACKQSLIKAGWTITHDPYKLRRGRQTLYIDLGAEMILAAEKEGRKIAVEIKSMLGAVEMAELERALGQYVLYRSLLVRRDPNRTLYLAISLPAYLEHFDTAEGRDLINDETIRLIVFNPVEEEIIQWID